MISPCAVIGIRRAIESVRWVPDKAGRRRDGTAAYSWDGDDSIASSKAVQQISNGFATVLVDKMFLRGNHTYAQLKVRGCMSH